LRESGLIEEDLTLPVRARDRPPIFLKAAWRILVANPRLLLLYAPWVILVEAVGWADSRPSAVPAVLDVFPEWLGLNVALFVGYTVGAIGAFAVVATVLAVLRGHEFNLGRAIGLALQNLFTLALLTLVFAVPDLLGQLLEGQFRSDGIQVLAFLEMGALGVVLTYAIPVIADTGGGFVAAIAGSRRLLRRSWRDVLLFYASLSLSIVFAIGASFVMFIAGSDLEGGVFLEPLRIVSRVLMVALVTYFSVYAARLYLFARSVEAADERRDGAAR
jgi:hypothetical protein